MINRYHAQQQHIISSLDTLLYQLHTLSFFFAPSLLSLLCRLIAQTTKPRDDDISHSLRFYLVVIMLLNFPSLWYHTMYSSLDDRAVVLDFVGLAYVPSKLQLITLDATIILLQAILATISYEMALSMISEQDSLTPSPPLELPSHTPSSWMESKESHSTQYVIDLRFKPFLSRLRHPPAPRPANTNSSTPVPNNNTTPWSFPSGMGMALLRAGRRARIGGSNRTNGRGRRTEQEISGGDRSEA